MMKITQKICIDLAQKRPLPRLDAVQNEAQTREIEVSLFENGAAWDIPAGTTAAVAFRKPDGTCGLYDRLPDGTDALAFSGHRVTATLAYQVLTCAGSVRVSVILYDEALNQLATFPFVLEVEENPAAGEVVSNNYYNYSTLADINAAIYGLEVGMTAMGSRLEIETNSSISRLDKRVTNLEKGILPDPFLTDDSVAYTKTVPENALPYAEITEIGGMTRKCTNWIPFPYTDGGAGFSITRNGVTFTVQDDGSVVANGTATANSIFVLANYSISLAAGTYTMSGVPSEGSSSTFMIQGAGRDGTGATNNSSVAGTKLTLGQDVGDYLIQLVVFKNYTANNIVFKPMLNSGSTALPYEPFFEGLRSAPVTAVESVGVNIAPPFNIGVGVNDSTGEIAAMNRQATTDFIRVDGANCVWSNMVSNLFSCVYFYNENREYLGRSAGSPRSQFAISANVLTANLTNVGGEITYIRLWLGENATATGTIDLVEETPSMLNKGTTALPYTPYFKRTLEIPEAVQALDGYGWSVSEDIYNYIDYEKKQFVKRVGVVDLGTLYWGAWSDKVFGTTTLKENIKKPNANTIPNALCDAYEVGDYFTIITSAIRKGVAISDAGSIAVYTKNAMTIDDFKAAMSGVMLYYELAEPIITDISDILPADNFIEVEGGGTVTMVNEYGYDVPSEITYQIKEEG